MGQVVGDCVENEGRRREKEFREYGRLRAVRGGEVLVKAACPPTSRPSSRGLIRPSGLITLDTTRWI